MSPRLTAGDHLSRASEHQQVAELLFNVDEDWSAVAYFYSAYHLVRAALLTDPIFDDFARLRSVDSRLLPEDRFTDRHKGRITRTDVQFGINDLVRILYGVDVVRPYEFLHQSSIQVRYQNGLRYTRADVRDAHQQVEAFKTSGMLVCTGP